MSLVGLACLVVFLPVTSHQYGDLLETIRPERYELLINTDFNDWTYSGAVNITVDVSRSVQEIRLHAAECVAIETIKLCSHPCAGDDSVNVLNVSARHNVAKDLLIFPLSTPLNPGTYVIRSTFTGIVSSKLVGFFSTEYEMIHPYSGKKKYVNMTSTHLSPDKARTVFPSFDEPQFRANFSLTLVHPKEIIATSNMPIKEVISLNCCRKLTKFEDTPKMSTYILGWVQHNFDYEPRTITSFGREVELRHFYPPGIELNLTSSVLDKLGLLEDSLKFYNNYFGIPYPLPKLDLIGIPNYMFGGMEHWGLITMNLESAISKNDKRFGSSEVWLRNLIPHEVAHMWFGNLVTMQWWNDLWLKEGMASLLSYVCADSLYDDVDMRDHHMLDNWQSAMLADQAVTSQPVQMPILLTSEITQAFNSITYAKGATVLAMLRDVFGEGKFKSGMNRFLKTHQYSTANYEDLLTSMTDHVDDKAQIKEFVDSYILQKNYPLVSVNIVTNRKIKLTQSRFVKTSNSTKLNDISYHWSIPITVTGYKENVSVNMLNSSYLMMTDKSMEVEFVDAFDVIKLNLEGKSMYVTHYPVNNLIRLIDLANRNESPMSYRDRGHLICDIFNGAAINLISYSTALEAAKILQKEDHYLPWTLAFKYFELLKNQFDGNLALCFQGYVYHIIKPQLMSSLSTKFSLKDQLKKEVILRYLNLLVQKQNTSLGEKELSKLEDYKSLSEEERSTEKILFDTSKPLEIKSIGNILIKYPSSDPSVLLDFIKVFSSVSPETVWIIYKENFDYYNEKHGRTQFVYAEALAAMIGNQRDAATIREIERFFVSHPARAGSLGVEHGLEKARFNIKFREDSESDLLKYFEGHGFCNFSKNMKAALPKIVSK